jgi:hypothetical protein
VKVLDNLELTADSERFLFNSIILKFFEIIPTPAVPSRIAQRQQSRKGAKANNKGNNFKNNVKISVLFFGI